MTEPYDVLLADPPWSYDAWDENTGPQGRTAAKHYSVMSVDDICELPIGELANENAVLFLWAVWPSIYESRRVIEAWGFTYRTIAWVWAKLNPSSLGFHTGLGYYTRANTEPCLLAVRGSMPPAVKDVLALIVSPVREHSRKPDEQYGKIDRLYPGTRRLELFARRPYPGWDVWGNEVDGIEIEGVMYDEGNEGNEGVDGNSTESDEGSQGSRATAVSGRNAPRVRKDATVEGGIQASLFE